MHTPQLFAKAIHEISGKKGTFVPRNCAAIPDQMFEGEFFGHKKGAFTGADKDKTGAFEQAENGTIFLDEIGELELGLQARFLRVLQAKEIAPVGGKPKLIDFQAVSATNQDLKELISKKQFREDLFHRINDYTINIPSLIDRKDDIDLLVHHFINKYDRALSEDPSLAPLIVEKNALKMLEDYNWPGNVRELEKACKLVMAFRDIEDRSEIRINEFSFKKSDIPIASKSPERPVKSKNLPGNTKITPDQVKQAMKNNNGNKTKAAKELGVTYHTVLRHCKELGI